MSSEERTPIMKKRIIGLSLAILVMLVITSGVIYAQGYGSGNATGQGGYCLDPTLCQTNNYGSGTGNIGSGRWGSSDMTRGNMRGSRGTAAGNGITAGNGSASGNGMVAGNGGYYATLPPTTGVELSDSMIAAMTAGWLDEQHAYATYEAIINQFGNIAPFVNIQRSEAQHIASWELMFDRYGVELPAVPEFDTPEFATLSAACQAAADAEIANFGLYDTMLATLSDFPDMVQVITTLRNASEFSHLPAFQNCAS
jgi:hypothetical protein